MEDRLASYSDMLKQHIYASCSSMTRRPAGRLRHPYITPTSEGSPYYSDTLWDWDSWLTGIAFAQLEADGDNKGKYMDLERGGILMQVLKRTRRLIYADHQ